MKILALDAATEACSVALQINNEIISLYEVAPQQHSQKLLPFVDQVLAQAGIKLNQLDAIAFGQGPGSFTGVRIGVAITQGLAFGADLPTIGVSNLAVMAQQAIIQLNAQQVVAAIDARMSEVYLASFDNLNGIAIASSAESVIKPELIEVTPLPQAIAVGTGWQTYKNELLEKFQSQLSDISLPNAEFMLPLAIDAFHKGELKEAEAAQPNYVRDEVSWKKLPGR